MTSERRHNSLTGELQEVRAQLESAERSRKSAEHELVEASERVSELNAHNTTLSAAKRKIESDLHAIKVSQISAVPNCRRFSSMCPFYIHKFHFRIHEKRIITVRYVFWNSYMA